MIDRLEKAGRFALWVALALLCLLVPVNTYLQQRAAERLAEQARSELERQRKEAADKDKQLEESKKTKRLSLKSMGTVMHALDGSSGHVWFTNASDRNGVVCLDGTASHASSGQKTRSLTSCEAVGPYASNVKMSLMFAGADVRAVCPDGGCQFTVEDAAVAVAPAAAPAK